MTKSKVPPRPTKTTPAADARVAAMTDAELTAAMASLQQGGWNPVVRREMSRLAAERARRLQIVFDHTNTAKIGGWMHEISEPWLRQHLRAELVHRHKLRLLLEYETACRRLSSMNDADLIAWAVQTRQVRNAHSSVEKLDQLLEEKAAELAKERQRIAVRIATRAEGPAR